MTSTTQEAVTADARALPQARLVALFVVYLVLLTWAVLWKLEVPWVGEAGWRIVKLVPFVATSGAGASTPFDVVANLALFVPLGLYLGLLVPSWRWWKVACAAAAASLGLEVAQYVLAVGSSDLTDVVVNTAGALVGLGCSPWRAAGSGEHRRGPDARLRDRDRARRPRERARRRLAVALRTAGGRPVHALRCPAGRPEPPATAGRRGMPCSRPAEPSRLPRRRPTSG